jgi:hypothetical protein
MPYSAAAMAFTALTNIFWVSSAPFGGAFVRAGTYDGPDIGDSAEFRGFINARWQEAQARGHKELMVTRVEVPALSAGDFPGLLFDISHSLSRNDYEGVNEYLDRVPDMVHKKILDHMTATAEVTFTCKQGDGIHMSVSSWKPAGEQCVAVMLAPAGGKK